ncbi:MAG TPA: BTAD domain-containing putative transcriptional regulator [Chloroflexota bacterium]
MPMLELNFLGVPEVVLDGKPLTFARRGSVGLLAYLVLSRRAHAREALATLLAGDSSEDQARKYLSNVLVDLRQMLGSYVVATRQTVVFDRNMPHRVDVMEFQSRFANCLKGDSLVDLDAAARLYRDEFLVGLALVGAPDFEAWVLTQREELRGQFVQVLQAQVQMSLRQAAWSAGIAPARRLLAQEPWLEEVHRNLMLMLARSGQRQAAIAQYQACKRVLAEELGVEPLPATTAMFNRLRAAITPPAHNLPAVGAPFVGRATQLRQLVSLMSEVEVRLLTIVGLGGSGKTRLAIEVALAYATPATLPPEQPFPDGIVFVSYADSTPRDGAPETAAEEASRVILSGLIAALGLSEAPSNAAGAQQVLSEHLRDTAMLLVLDNLEHLQAGVGALEVLLRHAPNVRILATARTPLHLAGERVLHVDGLELPDAADELERAEASALFLQEARRASLGFEPAPHERPHIVELCRLLGGFPLAVILAARWAPIVGCQTVVNELAEGLDVLSTSEPDLPQRHRSIAGILDSTLARLTREERELTHTIARDALDRGKRGRGSKSDFPRDLLPRLRPLSEHSLLSVDHTHGTLRVHPLLPLHARGRTDRSRAPARVAWAEAS